MALINRINYQEISMKVWKLMSKLCDWSKYHKKEHLLLRWLKEAATWTGLHMNTSFQNFKYFLRGYFNKIAKKKRKNEKNCDSINRRHNWPIRRYTILYLVHQMQHPILNIGILIFFSQNLLIICYQDNFQLFEIDRFRIGGSIWWWS